MIEKKTLALSVAISWVLTLVTLFLISNFVPSLTQPFTQQFTESNSVKVITFTEQEETLFTNTEFEYPFGYITQNFTWTPSNPNNNDILGFICYFEYKVNATPQTNWYIDFTIDLNRFNYWISEGVRSFHVESSDWQTASFKIIPNTKPASYNWINPNQSKYPIKISFIQYGNEQTHIRNVNLILLVIDG